MFHKIHLKRTIKSMNIVHYDKFVIYNKIHRKAVQKQIRQIINQYNIRNTSQEYRRAIGNAIAHGKLPVKIKVFVGDQGDMIFVIKDAGVGFDYKDIIRKFYNNQKYYHYHGRGTKSYASNDQLYVDWKHNGRTIILHYI